MLNNVSVGKYFETSSNVHRMHPLSKIICLFIFIIMILIVNNPLMIGILTLLLMVMIINTKVPLNVYYYEIINLKALLLIIFLFSSLIGTSFIFGLFVLIKIIVVVIYLSILTLTTPTTEIIYGLEKFLYPLNKFNIRSNVWALNIGLGLRFVPTLIDVRNNILKSQITRGIDYRLGISSYIISMKGMVGPAIKLSIRKLKKLKESMMIRLYSMYKTRCNFRMNSWRFFDSLLVFIHVVILIFIIVGGVFL